MELIYLQLSLVPGWAEPISYMHYLGELHLYSCRISGPIPINHFLNLTNLYFLGMGFNFFYSPIPIQLANLTSLSILDLAGSHLRGSLPFFPQLEQFNVYRNINLTVDLPMTFANSWPHLKIFVIQNTHVIGPIPSSISNSTSLVEIYASSSLIQGSIPSSLFNLSNLQYPDLSYNNITGFLPSSFSSLRNLEVMNLFQNNLTGGIPDSICEVSSIQILNLAGNHVNGSLPDCVGRLPNLQAFRIDDNSMEGSVSSLFSFFQNSTPNEVVVSSSGITVETNQHLSPSNFQLDLLGLNSCKLRGKFHLSFQI